MRKSQCKPILLTVFWNDLPWGLHYLQIELLVAATPGYYLWFGSLLSPKTLPLSSWNWLAVWYLFVDDHIAAFEKGGVWALIRNGLQCRNILENWVTMEVRVFSGSKNDILKDCCLCVGSGRSSGSERVSCSSCWESCSSYCASIIK